MRQKHDCATCRRLDRQLRLAFQCKRRYELYLVQRLLVRLHNHQLTCPNWAFMWQGKAPFEIPAPTNEERFIRECQHMADEDAQLVLYQMEEREIRKALRKPYHLRKRKPKQAVYTPAMI